MKKICLVSSLVLLAAWIAGFFFISSSPVVHIFLWLAVLLYIRSLMMVGAPAGLPAAEKQV